MYNVKYCGIDAMCFIWHNVNVGKIVVVDKRADKELKKFPHAVQLRFYAIYRVLEVRGKLEEPDGKKLSGSTNLFEIRVKYQGQWRAIYAYLAEENIVVLSAFSKKTQKTPSQELDKAKKRLLEYLRSEL
jgi:phage-related protein